MSSLKQEFLAKASSMRQWRPTSAPSNRDRLELYALHKQAAAGDCDKPAPTGESRTDKADKGKWSAWRSKSGLSQAEAMSRYIAECDRQIRVYGSLAGGPTTTTVEKTSNAPTQTPLPTPNPQQAQQQAVGLTGIESVPLLASAASESHSSYMSRLSLVSPGSAHASGFWSRQIPLYGNDETSTFATGAEKAIIKIGQFLESATSNMTLGPLPPSSFHSLSYPLHIILLSHWILLIYLLSITSTVYVTTKTLLLGSSATGLTLPQIHSTIITPTSLVATSLLTSPQHSLPVRFIGLLLTPLTVTTDVTTTLTATAGHAASSFVYCALTALLWWYYTMVIPWSAAAMTWSAGGYGGCLAIIEYAGV